MRAQIRHYGGSWKIEDDTMLLDMVNKHCHRSGRMSWARVPLLPGRTLSAMQTRWKIIHPSCIFDGKKWNWRDEFLESKQKKNTSKSIREEVEEFLATYPNADNSTVANFVNCDQSYVSRIRKENEPKHKDIPEKKENARNTPQNASTGVLTKRVVVKKSFLWGAFILERYE